MLEGVGVENDMTNSDLKEHPLRNCAAGASDKKPSVIHSVRCFSLPPPSYSVAHQDEPMHCV